MYAIGGSSHDNNFSNMVSLVKPMCQFQEGEQEDGDSHCGDYGPSLGVSPPGRFSDTESLIEPVAVSSDFPLNMQYTPAFNGYRKKREELKRVRWRSCQELKVPQWLPGVLKRQSSEESIKILQGKQSSFRRLVEVYDGNLGVSVFSVSDHSCSTSPRLTETRDNNRPSCTGGGEFVDRPGLTDSFQSLKRRNNNVRTGGRHGGSLLCDGPGEATTNPETKNTTKLLSSYSPQQQLLSISPPQKSYSGHLAKSDNQNRRLPRRFRKENQEFRISEPSNIKVNNKKGTVYIKSIY